MNIREILPLVLGFIFCLFVQIFFLRNVVLFGYGFCFFYLAGILMLPNEIDRTLYLLIAFVGGVIVDIFSNTLGLHASSTVMIAFLRMPWVNYLTAKKGEELYSLHFKDMGLARFLFYLFPLILIHHTMLFSIEVSSLALIEETLLRIVASTIFTVFSIVVFESFNRK